LVTTHRTAIPLRAGRANDRPGCEELLNGVLSGGETLAEGSADHGSWRLRSS
jgi:hypothetical protein